MWTFTVGDPFKLAGKRYYIRAFCSGCSQIRTVNLYNYKYGKSTQCRQCAARKQHTKHGMHNTPIYKVWVNMIQRCTNSNIPRYNDYGGRGIQVCDRWRNSFEDFLADVGEPPEPKMQLDRINNDGNYEPANCRWVTPKANAGNRRKRKDAKTNTVDGNTTNIERV